MTAQSSSINLAQYNKNVNQTINNIIAMKETWQRLKKEYAQNKISVDILKRMGQLRRHIVWKDYEICSHDRNVGITITGSDNPTSDMDITLTGRFAPDVVKCMVTNYLLVNKSMMASILDSNIYCGGFFSLNDLRPDLANANRLLILPEKQLAVILPVSPAEKQLILTFALLDLDEQYIPVNCRSRVRQLMAERDTIRSTKQQEIQTEEQYAQAYEILKQLSPNDLLLYTNYMLQVDYANRVNNWIYSTQKSSQQRQQQQNRMLLKNACFTQVFSIESYYTPLTVLVVVLFLQQKYIKQSDIPELAFLCSVVENLREMIHHLNQPNIDLKTGLLHVSKYIYRIYASLAGLAAKRSQSQSARNFQTQARQVLQKVVSLRGKKPSNQQWLSAQKILHFDPAATKSAQDFAHQFALTIMQHPIVQSSLLCSPQQSSSVSIINSTV